MAPALSSALYHLLLVDCLSIFPETISSTSSPFELELRHNGNGDDEANYFTAFVSFSLNELRIEGQDSVKFVVTATDYEDVEFSEEGWFKYGDLEE